MKFDDKLFAALCCNNILYALIQVVLVMHEPDYTGSDLPYKNHPERFDGRYRITSLSEIINLERPDPQTGKKCLTVSNIGPALYLLEKLQFIMRTERDGQLRLALNGWALDSLVETMWPRWWWN